MVKTQALDPARLARQQEIVDLWERSGKAGTVEAATGFGKTTVALLAMRAYLGSRMVVVPTILLKNKWHEDLKRWGISAFVETVQTVSQQPPGHYDCDLLVLDEVHQYTAPVFRRVFESVRYRDVLGLTATLPEEDERRQVITDKAPVIATVTLLECLQNGFVAPFQVYNLPVEMTEEEDERYETLNKNYSKQFAIFSHDFDLAMRCVTSEAARIELARGYGWVNRYGDVDEKRVAAAAFQWIKNTQERKQLLYNLRSKHEKALEIIEMFPDRLTVTFSQTIDSAELMSELLGNRALPYHSQIKGGRYGGQKYSAKAMRELHLKRFASQHHWSKTNVLCTAKAFDVGADVPHIDMGIVLSGTSKQLQAIQRYGRTLRKVDGKRTIIVELYATRRGGGSTQDMKWLRSRQKSLRSQVAWIHDAAQIV